VTGIHESPAGSDRRDRAVRPVGIEEVAPAALEPASADQLGHAIGGRLEQAVQLAHRDVVGSGDGSR
jgi:hypothetical protein